MVCHDANGVQFGRIASGCRHALICFVDHNGLCQVFAKHLVISELQLVPLPLSQQWGWVTCVDHWLGVWERFPLPLFRICASQTSSAWLFASHLGFVGGSSLLSSPSVVLSLLYLGSRHCWRKCPVGTSVDEYRHSGLSVTSLQIPDGKLHNAFLVYAITYTVHLPKCM